MTKANENTEYVVSAKMTTAEYGLSGGGVMGQVWGSFRANRQFDKKCINLYKDPIEVARQDRASSSLGALNGNTPATTTKIIELPRNDRVMRHYPTNRSDISSSNCGRGTIFGLSSQPGFKMKVYGHNLNEEVL